MDRINEYKIYGTKKLRSFTEEDDYWEYFAYEAAEKLCGYWPHFVDFDDLKFFVYIVNFERGDNGEKLTWQNFNVSGFKESYKYEGIFKNDFNKLYDYMAENKEFAEYTWKNRKRFFTTNPDADKIHNKRYLEKEKDKYMTKINEVK